MKIKRLELDNFIGIYAGLGLYHFELDLSNSKHTITLLRGGNGSGKSTIMSQLHPMKESFDGREQIILPDKIGKKRIIIQEGTDEYDINYTYSKKVGEAKAYIKKNGIELNESGLLGSCYEIIEKEIGATKDYFRGIGQIGSNTKSFVEYSTAERKSYISKFLPDTAPYIEKFKLIKDKFKQINQDMNATINSLQQYGDISVLEEKKANLELAISTSESNIESLLKSTGSLQGDIKRYNNIFDGKKSYEDILVDWETKTLKKKENDDQNAADMSIYSLPNYNSKPEEVLKIAEEQDKIVVSTTEEINENLRNISRINALIQIVENEISKLNIRLNQDISSQDISEIENEITENENKLKSLKEYLGTISYAKEIGDEMKNIQSYISSFRDFKEFIIKYFGNLMKKDISPEKTNIEYFFEEGFQIVLNENTSVSGSAIKNKEALLEAKKASLSAKNSNLSKIDILNQRPKECSINICPFIADALQYKDLPQEIKKLEKEIQETEKSLETLKNNGEVITEVANMYKLFLFYYERLNPRSNILYKEFLKKYTTTKNIINLSINEFSQETEKLIKDSSGVVDALKSAVEANSFLTNLKSRREAISAADKNKKTIEKDINDKKDLLAKYKEELKSYEEKRDFLNVQMTKEKSLYEVYSSYITRWKESNSLGTQLSTLNSKKSEYEEAINGLKVKSDQLASEEVTLKETKELKAKSQQELTLVSNSLYDVKNLLEKKKLFQEEYNDLDALKKVLDPNKGIPLYFIRGYLDKTKSITNHLLKLAFGDDFEISFNTTESDFFIRVRAGDNVKDDIKAASQGEIALTTISISLALMEQSIKKYNIMSLDEIDGSLDKDNRQNFIEILNKQISDLGIEQMFIISHNAAFDNCPLDLILLKRADTNTEDEEFMKNKNILLDAR